MTSALPFLARRLLRAALIGAALAASVLPSAAHDGPACRLPGCAATEPYPAMPEIAPIGVRVEHYLPVPAAAQGPAIDPAQGYRIQALGRGLYMVTDNIYQAMFMVHARGVIVVDVPPSIADALGKAIAETTDRPITHIVYSHAHLDHIGGAGALVRAAGSPEIVAHDETLRLLQRAQDPARPLPTRTFGDHMTLEVGGQSLRLSYHGNAHEPGNIFIHAPEQRTLMVVDVIFPGWMPWRRLALAQDVRGYFDQVELIRRWDFDTLVGGHVARTGTKADVELQSEFLRDLKAAAGQALKSTVVGDGLAAADRGNPWAVYDHFIDRVALQCVNALTPKWKHRLAAFDVYIWDQCFTMEQSLRLD